MISTVRLGGPPLHSPGLCTKGHAASCSKDDNDDGTACQLDVTELVDRPKESLELQAPKELYGMGKIAVQVQGTPLGGFAQKVSTGPLLDFIYTANVRIGSEQRGRNCRYCSTPRVDRTPKQSLHAAIS